MKKKIGLLGLGNRSTVFYLEQLNKCYCISNKQQDATCPLLLINTDFSTLNPYLPDQFSKLEPQLLIDLQQVIYYQIEKLIIPNITLHECYERLLTREKLPDIIHPLTALQQHIDINEKVILFGSKHTMNNPWFIKSVEALGIDILAPSADDQELIDKTRRLIYHYQENPDLLQQFQQKLTSYSKNHKVIIACTELSIALSLLPKTVEDRVYDLSLLQIQSALNEE